MLMKAVTGAAISASLLLSNVVLAQDCETKSKLWPYEFKKGNDKGEILIYADLYAENNCESITAEVKAGATGELFEMSADLVEAKATSTLKGVDIAAVEGSLTVMGNVVGEFKRSLKDAVTVADTLVYPVKMSDKMRFMVGPVPVAIDYGLVGEGGLAYRAGLAGNGSELKADPFVDSKVFAATGLDVKIAEVKVHGDVILAQDKMENTIALGLNLLNEEKSFTLDAKGLNSLTALDGRISALAKVNLGGSSQDIERDLVSWEGISRDDQAYRVELEYPLPL